MAPGSKKDDALPEETSQIPVDAPRPEAPDASERIDFVPPPEAAVSDDAVEATKPDLEPKHIPGPESGSGGSALIGGDLAEKRPEAIVAGAFVGAFVLAKVLKRITGG
jgi:hypothetical protein